MRISKNSSNKATPRTVRGTESVGRESFSDFFVVVVVAGVCV